MANQAANKGQKASEGIAQTSKYFCVWGGRLRIGTRRRVGVTAVLLLVFVVIGFVKYASVDGDDLSASYVGCRVLAAGEPGHLFRHDPVDFSELGNDPVWTDTADQANFNGTLHPYVQAPLWAYGLRPLCTRVGFSGFERVFAALELLCFAGSIGLIAWFWAPSLLHPGAMTVLLAVLWFSVPFRYAMVLMQTHVLFFAMTVGALILAERRKPGWAGLLLACAAMVKLTPGLLVVYWLITRRWKAALSTAAWGALLSMVMVLAVGWPLTAEYLREVHRISGVLLLAMNNQSLAAWWMGWLYPAEMTKEMTMLPLPALLRAGSLLLMIGVTVFGGLIDRRRTPGRAPVGAMMGVVAASVFAPIAWSHYSIVLVAPLMVLWEERLQIGRRGWAAIWLVVALTYRPLAVNVLDWQVGRYSLVRSEFYASLACLAVLGFVGWTARSRSRSWATTEVEADSSLVAIAP